MKKLIKSFIFYILIFYKKKLYNKDIKIYVISGSPRSGTTFLAEYLANYLGNPLMIWEPLQNNALSKLKIKELRPVMLDVQKDKKLYNYLINLPKLKNLSFETLWLSNIKYLLNFIKIKNQNLIIKFTRGNGIVDLYKTVPNTIKIFLIVRNPLSVIASQIEHHEFQGHPIISYSSKHAQDLLRAKIKFKGSNHIDLALTWLNDFLNALNSENAIIINYSDFLNKNEMILKFLDTNMKKTDFIGLSSTFNPLTKNNGSFETKWTKTLTKKQASDIFDAIKFAGYLDEVITFFRLKEIYLDIEKTKKYENT